MDLEGNTILITGGSSGIGMALAARFIELGNEVIVTGRRKAALQAFKDKYPSVHTQVNDAGNAADRVALADWATRAFPGLNVLINNAGIQRKLSLREVEPWADTAQELDINLGAPIHLSSLFIPHLQKQAKAWIMNVSSGLAFVPLAHMPVYCASKAALHSFTMSLREQLKADHHFGNRDHSARRKNQPGRLARFR
ncbi:MAG: SDR family NAD(P)-dependent oxidoreductase [Pseudomonadota bacterium]